MLLWPLVYFKTSYIDVVLKHMSTLYVILFFFECLYGLLKFNLIFKTYRDIKIYLHKIKETEK